MSKNPVNEIEIGNESVTASEGLKASTKFGEVLYNFKSKEVNNQVTNVIFYEQVVIFQHESSFACYPKWFTQEIIPKYKFKSVKVSKGNPMLAIFIGVAMLIIGLILLPLKIGSTKLQTPGIVVLSVGLLVMAIPFCLKTFTTTLEVTVAKEVGTARVLGECAPACFSASTRTISIVSDVEPDALLLFEYVYGTLAQNMDQMHLTNHLIHDDLTRGIKPHKLGDIQLKCDEESAMIPVATPYEDTDVSTSSFPAITTKKFGILLNKLVSEVSGAGIFNEKTVCSFYQQICLLQVERKIACWPVWYDQKVIPKYKFKSMTTAKADPTATVAAGMFFLVVGAALAAIKSLKMLPVGIVLCLVGVGLLILPFFVKTYDSSFEIVSMVRDEGCAKFLRKCFFLQNSESFTIRTSHEPDTDGLMEYVYGPLSEELAAAHSLNHLIHDDITEILAPHSLDDLDRGAQ